MEWTGARYADLADGRGADVDRRATGTGVVTGGRHRVDARAERRVAVG